MAWLWISIHMTWGLKLISWVVTTRVYREHYNRSQFLEFFYHPAFFVFTNDLNVLTPRRFFRSATPISEISFNGSSRAIFQTVIGLILIGFYGLVQQFYFKNLDHLGVFGTPWVGGAVSIATAILFHAANVYLQIALLATSGYSLPVDMNRPWLAISPSDYWRRMHFYVREYVYEIIIKPLMTWWMRRKASVALSRISLVAFIYLLFTFTQVGYQPYRQDRSFVVGLLVTAVFVAMFALPELLSPQIRRKAFLEYAWVGRLLTVALLYFGYTFIFKMRLGF